MKAYSKPVLEIERFTPNEAVAWCEGKDVEEFDPQVVSCLVDGQERIFYSDACDEDTGGITGVDIDEGTSGGYYFGNVNGTYYFCWPFASDTIPSHTPDSSTRATMEAVMTTLSGGDVTTARGWHVAVATATIHTYYNSSH